MTVDLSKMPASAHGFTLDFRPKVDAEWPLPYRARVVYGKGEHDDARLIAYGATAQDAVDELVDALTGLVTCAVCVATVPASGAYYDPVADGYVCDACYERYAP